ncbi:MAG TPA: hypothetical protein VFL82_01605 [Thermomicrobiales bacterium]|nr:hypothetical protein [Thermomicrobiales bacterium]
MARDIITAFTEQTIGIGDSPAEQELVGMPPIRVAAEESAGLKPPR